MSSFEDMDKALHAAQDAWTGCNWDTEFGPWQANLRGLTSRQARLAAKATRGDEAVCWEQASQFLEAIEQDARKASEIAAQAVVSWQNGDITTALRQLDEAIVLESRYRAPLAYGPLRERIASLTVT